MSRADQSLKIVYPTMYEPASASGMLRPGLPTIATTSSSRSSASQSGGTAISSPGPLGALGLEK